MNQRLRIYVFVLMCVAACFPVHAQTQRETWNKSAEPFRIIDNIYYVGPAGLASYLITTPEGHILLDGALEESAPLIERNIQQLGFNIRDVKFLLNSHAHLDHSGGLAKLKQDSGATMVASEGDKSALEGGFYLGSENQANFNSVPVKVDRIIGDAEKLKLGGTTLTAHVTPGHTRGCTSWSMVANDGAKQLDVLFFCSISVAYNRLVNPPQYPTIVADYESSFQKLKGYHVDVFLAPHPEMFDLQGKKQKMMTGAANPFMDSHEFEAFLARAETDFRRQLAEQQSRAERK